MKKIILVIGLAVFSVVFFISHPVLSGSCPTYSTAKSKYLSQADLSGCSCWDLDLLRNEIFARHGRKFKRQDLKEYFSDKPWYSPTNSSGVAGQNKFEKKNAGTIASYERTRGCVAGKSGKSSGSEESETAEIFAATKKYVDAHSSPDMRGKYKLKLASKVGKWAVVSVLPTIETEGAGVILENVNGKWIPRDMGTDLSDWSDKIPGL